MPTPSSPFRIPAPSMRCDVVPFASAKNKESPSEAFCRQNPQTCKELRDRESRVEAFREFCDRNPREARREGRNFRISATAIANAAGKI